VGEVGQGAPPHAGAALTHPPGQVGGDHLRLLGLGLAQRSGEQRPLLQPGAGRGDGGRDLGDAGEEHVPILAAGRRGCAGSVTGAATTWEGRAGGSGWVLSSRWETGCGWEVGSRWGVGSGRGGGGAGAGGRRWEVSGRGRVRRWRRGGGRW